jgi:hypothetical protein
MSAPFCEDHVCNAICVYAYPPFRFTTAIPANPGNFDPLFVDPVAERRVSKYLVCDILWPTPILQGTLTRLLKQWAITSSDPDVYDLGMGMLSW